MTAEEWGAEMARAIRDNLPMQCRVVKIVRVDPAKWTAEVKPIDSEAEFYDVRLRATADGLLAGLLVVPKEGSTALLQLIGNDPDMGYLSLFSEVERVFMKVAGGSTVEVSGSEIKLNGDALGGLVIVDNLVQRLNRLEQRMNTHQHLLFNIPTLPDPATNSPLPPTTTSDLENPNVKHG